MENLSRFRAARWPAKGPARGPAQGQHRATSKEVIEGEQGKNQGKDFCAELSLCETTAPVAIPVISLPLNDGSEFSVPQELFDKWVALYPAVDVMQELRKMVGWLDSTPNKRKTLKGIKRFCTSWLSHEQDRGGSGNGAGSHQRTPLATTEWQKKQQGFRQMAEMLNEKRRQKEAEANGQ